MASDSCWGSSLRQVTASLRICSSLKDTTIVFRIIPASCNLMSPRFPLITMRPFFTPTNIYLTNTLLSHSVTQSCLILCDPMVTKIISPQSMGFHGQEYWSGLPFPPPGDLPNPEIYHMSPALAGGFFTTEPLGMPTNALISCQFQLCFLISNTYNWL